MDKQPSRETGMRLQPPPPEYDIEVYIKPKDYLAKAFGYPALYFFLCFPVYVYSVMFIRSGAAPGKGRSMIEVPLLFCALYGLYRFMQSLFDLWKGPIVKADSVTVRTDDVVIMKDQRYVTKIHFGAKRPCLCLGPLHTCALGAAFLARQLFELPMLRQIMDEGMEAFVIYTPYRRHILSMHLRSKDLASLMQKQ